MSASKTSIRGVFYPDEINDMRDELSRGDVSGETEAEREARAQEIFERNRRNGEANLALQETRSARPSTDPERHAQARRKLHRTP